MNANNSRENLESRLDDLATGQLGPWASFRLHREIARDPEAARIWEDVRRLRADLRSISPPFADRRPYLRGHRTFTIGGITMKQRTAAFAAGGLMLLSVSGALAERYLMPRDAEWGTPGPNRDTDWWWLHGQFRGHVELLTPEGRQVGYNAMQGSTLQGSVHVVFSQKGRDVLHCAVSGLGKHPLTDTRGKLLGYLVLSGMTKKDIKDISDSDALDDRTFAEFYRLPERVTPSGEGRNFSAVVSYTDVVSDCVTEFDVSGHGLSCAHDLPVSWKTYGDVHVRSRYFAPAEAVPLLSQNPAKQHLTVRLPKRTIIDEGQSDVYPSPQELAKMSPADRQDSLRSFPSPHLTPTTYWTIAKPGTHVSMETGKWEQVLETGKLTGYGHFLVRDKTGRVVLSLDVMRPTRKPGLTPEQGGDTVKPQKIVPGWDGEE